MTVYVPQTPVIWDVTRGSVPKFDISAAEVFGPIETIFPSFVALDAMDMVVSSIYLKLKDFGPRDHLLMVGGHVVVALCLAVAADLNNGTVKVLMYSTRERQYKQHEVRLFEENGFMPGGWHSSYLTCR